ncbi:MAG: hypothetical protein WAP35_09005 [Solirubrobacterales bacterium]
MNAVTVERVAADPVALDAPSAAIAVASANDELAAHTTIPRSVADVVKRLTEEILASDIEHWLAIDPYHALLVHRAILEAQEAVGVADDRDARDRLRIALGRLTNALALVGEADPVGEQRTTKQVAQWLVDAVDVPQKDLAALLGVDLRKFQRWISDGGTMQPEGDDARRVRTLAKIVNQLRHSLSAPGVVAWFSWPRADLGGKTPAALLNNVSRTPDLLLAAGSMRGTTLA